MLSHVKYILNPSLFVPRGFARPPPSPPRGPCTAEWSGGAMPWLRPEARRGVGVAARDPFKQIEERDGYGSIPIDTCLVGWTSIYQLFWGSLGTIVLTHPQISYINHLSFVQIQPLVRTNYKSQYDITVQMDNHWYNYWFPSAINSSINFTGKL